eukprot:m.102101 g.102101  ORF g.102101 m.102101 type:complete len:84 (-) comp13760_c0_seq1:96-347(-)
MSMCQSRSVFCFPLYTNSLLCAPKIRENFEYSFLDLHSTKRVSQSELVIGTDKFGGIVWDEWKEAKRKVAAVEAARVGQLREE